MAYHNSHPAKKVKSQKANGDKRRVAGRWRLMPRRVTKAPRTALGRRLLITRLALGYAVQADFADAIDVEPQTYNAWETGARSLPQRGTGLILAKFPELKIEWLTEGCPDRLPHGLVKKIEQYEASIPPPGSRDPIIRNPRI